MIKNYLLISILLLSIGGFFGVASAMHKVPYLDCPDGLKMYSPYRPHDYELRSSPWMIGKTTCTIMLKNYEIVRYLISDNISYDDCKKFCDYPNSCRNGGGGGKSAKRSVFDGGLFAPINYLQPSFQSQPNLNPVSTQSQPNPSPTPAQF